MPEHFLTEPDEPSQRGKEIYKVINGLMHLYLNSEAEDLAQGIPTDEHYRRHFVFYCGFVSGLEYMAEYPQQAVKLLHEWRKHMNDGKVKPAVDEAMARINEQLYPYTPPKSVADKLIELAQKYQPEDSRERVRPKLAEGRLVWDNVEPGELPFPTWEQEWQEWQ